MHYKLLDYRRKCYVVLLVCVELSPVQGVLHCPLPREHVMISPCIMHASLIGLRRNMGP